MAEEVKQSLIHVCSSCQGNGMVDNKACKACQGFGVVLWLTGKIFYWGKKYSRLKIIQEKQARKIRTIINFIFFVFGIAGLLCLAKVIYDFNVLSLGITNFSQVRNEYTLVFWLSALFDMYLVYRISRESKPRQLVEKRSVFGIKKEMMGEFKWAEVSKYKKYDISKSLSQDGLKLIEDTWLVASKLDHTQALNVHLFSSALSGSQVSLVFSRLGVDFQVLSQKLKRALNQVTDHGKTVISFEVKKTLLESYLYAYNQRKKKVRPVHVLYAIAHEEGIVKEILYDLSLTEREIGLVAEWVDFMSTLIARWRKLRYKASFKPKSNMNRAYTAIATPNLDQISRDMTLMAKAGQYDLCVNRQKEIDEIYRVLEVDRVGAILVGHTGVGKRTIVEAIAQHMVEEDVPKKIQDKRLVAMSVSGLIAGASKAGDLEARILTVMSEISRSKNILLFIEDIHHLVGVNAEGGDSMDVAEALAESMSKGNFMVLATTTPEYYKQYIERSSLAKVLQKVIVKEPTQDEVIRVLEAKTLELEGKHKIYFSYQSLEQIAQLSGRYLHDTYLPEKAIKILDEVALMVLQSRGEKAIVSAEDVANIVAEKTNIPVQKIAKDEKSKLLNLEQRIHERVIGQEKAVGFVSAALRRARTELRSKNRPIASFLFLGPTGVGKTEVAKTLADVYFGSEKNMIRIDMSEYQGNDALAKLIGNAETGKGGFLTEAVRKNPFSLILLDEIEKANFDILNVFLQVLDDGRLTDATGKTIDFTNSIIISTSNAGALYIQDEVKKGTGVDKIREGLINVHLKDKFRPEFLNRFDGIVVFHPLEMEHVIEIAKLFLAKLGQRLQDKGIGFRANHEAVKELAQLGYDPSMGARPLRRVIQDRVEDQLAKLFLAEELKRRDEVVLNKGLTLRVNKAQEI